MNKSSVQKSELMREAREQISRAITAALIDVRDEQERLRKDNQMFKEGCQKSVKFLENQINSNLESTPCRIEQATAKKFSALGTKVGANATNIKNINRKAREWDDDVMTDMEAYCDLELSKLSQELHLELLNTRNLTMHRIKATLMVAWMAFLFSALDLAFWVYVLWASGFWK